jgi:hypothetical protein
MLFARPGTAAALKAVDRAADPHVIDEKSVKRALVGGNSRSGRYADTALTRVSQEETRLREVEDAFASLPERYLGRIRIPGELPDRAGRPRLSWAVELGEDSCGDGLARSIRTS